MRRFLPLVFLLFALPMQAQPFVELFSFQQTRMPQSDLYRGSQESAFQQNWTSLALNIPVPINRKTILLASPSFDEKAFEPMGSTFRVLSLPLGVQCTLHDTAQKLTFLAIAQLSGPADHFWRTENKQQGAVAIYSFQRNEKRTWKAGLYYNREFYGNYWLVLLGLDWQLNERLFLWALLPRSAKLDYTLTNQWHTGIAFRGMKESYRTGANSWLSLEQGHLRLYADYYLKQLPLTLTIEAGQTIFSKLESGAIYQDADAVIKPAEDYLFRAGISSRFMTNKNFKTARTPKNW